MLIKSRASDREKISVKEVNNDSLGGSRGERGDTEERSNKGGNCGVTKMEGDNDNEN